MAKILKTALETALNAQMVHKRTRHRDCELPMVVHTSLDKTGFEPMEHVTRTTGSCHMVLHSAPPQSNHDSQH